jgi:hypothetical protein
LAVLTLTKVKGDAAVNSGNAKYYTRKAPPYSFSGRSCGVNLGGCGCK